MNYLTGNQTTQWIKAEAGAHRVEVNVAEGGDILVEAGIPR